MIVYNWQIIENFFFIINEEIENAPIIDEKFSKIHFEFTENYPIVEDGEGYFDKTAASLNALLNPNEFSFDKHIIDFFLEGAYRGVYKLSELQKCLINENNDGNIILLKKINFVIEYCEKAKKNTFSSYIKKFYDYDIDSDTSNNKIKTYRSQFCKYLNKIEINDQGRLIVIDKIVFDHNFRNEYIEFEKSLFPEFYKSRLPNLNEEIELIDLALFLNDKGSNILSDLKITLKDNRKIYKIKNFDSLNNLVFNEIKLKAEAILVKYNSIFDADNYNYLLYSYQSKNEKLYNEKISQSFGYEQKLNYLSEFLNTKSKNITLGIHSSHLTMTARIHNFLKQFIPTNIHLDFLTVEIMQFAKVEFQTGSDLVYYLPIKYNNVSDFARDRQDELDRKRKAWA